MKRMSLKDARKRAGLTQVELAKAAHLDQAYISKLELGKTSDPGFSAVVRLAKALGLDPRVLKFDQPAQSTEVSA